MNHSSSGILDILCIQLKPGIGASFNKLYIEQSLPIQRQWKVEVIAFGPSLDDDDLYFVVRKYKDLEDRRQSQDAFYGSEEWKQGPREAILASIEHSVQVVIPANDLIVSGLRMAHHLSEAGRK